MRILLVTGSINQGGAEFQLLVLANLFQQKGHDVQVLALTDYSYYMPFIKKIKFRYSCISNEGSKFKKVIKSVIAISRIKPQLVISFLRTTSQVAMLARVINLFRFKLIIAERTALVLPKYDLLYFNLALIANKITVNSISKDTYIKKRFPLLSNRTFFIPNIVNIEKFLNIERTESVNGFINISYIGRIAPEKNLINLIKAIRIVVEKGHLVALSLSGEANSKKYLQYVNQTIEELSLTNIVKYNGPVTDVTEVYKKTDLLCLISFFEGFSNVISEAISCGIPVLASNIEENRYLIEDKKNGFLVDPQSPKSVAEGIDQFLNLNQAEKESISKNNRQKAKDLFDEEDIYSKYTELFGLNIK
jgi:glycosyltransferase involved in cell wall biosynthesis